MNCLGFSEMQTICKDKRGKIIETKPIVKVKIASALVNMVDVHVTTQSKVIVKVKIASALVNMVDVHVTTQSKASEEYAFKD